MDPDDEPASAEPASPEPLRIDVERVGGVAGIPRRWSASAVAGDTSWWQLVERCPWPPADAAAEAPETERGADRFCWTVRLRQGSHHREVTLAEREMTGPWRTLVDAVRAGSALVEDGEE